MTQEGLLRLLRVQVLYMVILFLQVFALKSNAFTFPNPSVQRWGAHVHAVVPKLSSLAALSSSEDDPDPVPVPVEFPVTATGVTLKMAFDANYAVADMAPPSEKSERFTCPSSLDLVHKLRRNCDAVLVGRGTVVEDDCTLTVRRVALYDEERNVGRSDGDQPARIVVDPSLKLLKNYNSDGEMKMYKLLKDGHRTIIYHSCSDENIIKKGQQLDENVKLVQLGENNGDKNSPNLSAKQIIQDLQTHQNIQHIMVEGGPATAMQFLAEKVVDRAMIFRAPSVSFVQPMESGMGDEALENAGLVKIDCKPCGDDFVEYWVRKTGSVVDEWPGGSICIEHGWPY